MHYTIDTLSNVLSILYILCKTDLKRSPIGQRFPKRYYDFIGFQDSIGHNHIRNEVTLVNSISDIAVKLKFRLEK